MRKALVLLLLVAVAPMLSAFRPFTPVQSVCDKCPVKGDRVTLKNGAVVVAHVIGKNQDGWILENHGETRFAQFREVERVDFASGAEPKGLENYDQILIKNADQTLLFGTLIQIEAGKPLALRSPRGQVYMVSPDQVLVYYHRGKRRAPVLAPAS
ncbi:MAG: hypothetical protein RIT45_4407 [Pseudomonadota bacterium]|jgi:hypothetical protein